MKPRVLPTTAIRENRDGRYAWDGRTIEPPASFRISTWIWRALFFFAWAGFFAAMISAP